MSDKCQTYKGGKKQGFYALTCKSFSPGYETSVVIEMRTIMSSTGFPWLCSPKKLSKAFLEVDD